MYAAIAFIIHKNIHNMNWIIYFLYSKLFCSYFSKIVSKCFDLLIPETKLADPTGVKTELLVQWAAHQPTPMYQNFTIELEPYLIVI